MQAPRRLQLRRGNTTAISSYLGAAGELIINTDNNTLHVHDGVTVGGIDNVTASNTAMKGYVDYSISNISIPSTYSNANVASYLPTYSGDISANISKAGYHWTFGTDGTLNIPDSGDILRNGISVFNSIGSVGPTGPTGSTGNTGATTSSLIAGWYVVGTGIAIGATVTSGAGTSTITLSNACTGIVSGTITFYPPNVSNRQVVMTTTAPTITTGATTGQLMLAASSGVGGGTLGFVAALGAAPVAALSRYVITNTQLLGAALDQSTTNYNAGVATGGSTTTLVDASAFWATATGTGTAQTNTIALSAAAPGNVNGWYVTGTGINAGAYIVSGAGTTTLTLSVAHSGTVSGTITCAAWNQSLVNRKIKIQSGVTGLNQELTITAVTPTTGTITFALATAPIANVAVYSLLSIPVKGAGHEIAWASGNTDAASKGKYIWTPRGGATVGIDKLDITTDKIILNYVIPITETLGSGTMYAYDQTDRLYFTKDVTQRLYYLDVNTGFIHGAGVFPYVAGTAGIGNKMEIFTTVDGLKYLWVNRQQQQEHFRELLFF